MTTADPVELVRAQRVAITQICLESAALIFCRSGSALVAFLFALPVASVVACCSKQRVMYLIWIIMNVLVFCLHIITRATANEYDYSNEFFRVFGSSVPIFLSGLSCFAIYYGYKAISALGNPVQPQRVQVEVPAGVIAYHQPINSQP